MSRSENQGTRNTGNTAGPVRLAAGGLVTQPTTSFAVIVNGHWRRVEWITCKRCGERALVRVGGKGYCSQGKCRGSAGRRVKGGEHHNWKGDDASYSALHYRIHRLRGKADHCSQCGLSDPGKRYEWASLTGNYAEPTDYAPMCVPCHAAYDVDLRPAGEQHHAAKLTEAIVRTARLRFAAGEGAAKLGREYGVAEATMHKAVTRQTWKRVA